MSDLFDLYRQKVAGTNIDQRSLLSTDYFNTFNTVSMLLDMLPDAPELLEEVEQWQFYTYIEHFQASGLDFAPLAIEAYAHVPVAVKAAFETKIFAMRVFVEDSARTLRHLYDAKELTTFARFAMQSVALLRDMQSEGNAIIHGHRETLEQTGIDLMF